MSLPEQQSEQLPIEYFNGFISQELKLTIVKQSKLHSLRSDITKPLNLFLPEFEQWLRMAMYFFLSKIANTGLHGVKTLAMNLFLISRDRWTKIKSNLYLTGNQNVYSTDALYKIRLLVTELKKNFKKYL